MTTLKELKEMDVKATKGPVMDVKSALNSLFRLENDALSSRDGYGYSSGDAEIIRKVIMQYATLIDELPALIRVIELAEEALESCGVNESGQEYFIWEKIDHVLSEIRKLKGE